MDNRLSIIRDTLWDMNMPPIYLGTNYLAYAELLVLEDPDRLTMVTKWLYPEVAVRYHTSWKAVERDIRTVIALCWARDGGRLLEERTGTLLYSRPSPTGMIQLLARYFFRRPQEFWSRPIGCREGPWVREQGGEKAPEASGAAVTGGAARPG